MSFLFAWIKHNPVTVRWILLVVLLSTTSFALGYTLANNNNHTPIIIEKNSQ